MVGLKSRSFPVFGSDGQLVGMISREMLCAPSRRQHGQIASSETEVDPVHVLACQVRGAIMEANVLTKVA